jgi:hypothetical protein
MPLLMAGHILTTSSDTHFQERSLLFDNGSRAEVVFKENKRIWLSDVSRKLDIDGYSAQHYPQPAGLQVSLCTLRAEETHRLSQSLAHATFLSLSLSHAFGMLRQSKRAVAAVHFYGIRKMD